MKLFYPTKGDFITIVGNYSSSKLIKKFISGMSTSAIKVEKLKAPTFMTGIDFPDHMNYWKFGYKAIMITATSFYRNPNYHMKSDTVETLDFHKMTEVIKGLYQSLTTINTTK